MIMPDDDLVCPIKDWNNTGYHALYNVAEDSEISTGVLLSASVQGVIYLFQLGDTTNILSEDSIPVMEGTLFEYGDEKYIDEEIDYFNILYCRFPLAEELKWYNTLKTL